MQPLVSSTLLPPLTPSVSHAGALVRRLGQPFPGGNRVDLFNDGPATFDAIFRAMASGGAGRNPWPGSSKP